MGVHIENLLMIISNWSRMSRICSKWFVDVSEWLGFDGIKFQFKTSIRVVQCKSVEIQSDWIRFNLKLQFQSNRDQIYPDRIFRPNNSDSDLFRLKIRFRQIRARIEKLGYDEFVLNRNESNFIRTDLHQTRFKQFFRFFQNDP